MSETATSHAELLQTYHRSQYGTYRRPCSKPHREHRPNKMHDYHRRWLSTLECLSVPTADKAVSRRLHISDRQRNCVPDERGERTQGTGPRKSTIYHMMLGRIPVLTHISLSAAPSLTPQPKFLLSASLHLHTSTSPSAAPRFRTLLFAVYPYTSSNSETSLYEVVSASPALVLKPSLRAAEILNASTSVNVRILVDGSKLVV